MTALLSLYCEEGKRRAMDGRGKRRRAESTYRGDNRLNCQIHTFSSVPCVCVCACVLARHIPPGSDAVIHRDPQKTRRSGVSQALTFDEKISCVSLLLYSFTSS